VDRVGALERNPPRHDQSNVGVTGLVRSDGNRGGTTGARGCCASRQARSRPSSTRPASSAF
jgi:hypothetical protein